MQRDWTTKDSNTGKVVSRNTITISRKKKLRSKLMFDPGWSLT